MSEGQMRFWRDAATLIIAGKCSETVHGNYGVLMLERSSKSSFFPGAYVFPGGEVSDVDYTHEWSTLFNKVVSMTTDDVIKDFQVPGPRPPLMSSGARAANFTEHQKLDPCLAFRICAIRETFEESGLLLATKQISGRNHLTGSSSIFTHEKIGKDFELWRQKVQKDPWSFLAMCKEFKVVPNVWALREWNNWLTPVTRRVKGPSLRPYRFDTMFYACCLDHVPRAIQDSNEVTNVKWVVPRQTIAFTVPDKFRGPQAYELSRMVNFSLIDELFSYIRQREPQGIEQLFPVLYGCKDGLTSVLPGDGLYPEHPDRNGTEELKYWDKTVEELRNETSRFHRSEGTPARTYKYFCNIKLNCGQVGPVQFETSQL